MKIEMVGYQELAKYLKNDDVTISMVLVHGNLHSENPLLRHGPAGGDLRDRRLKCGLLWLQKNIRFCGIVEVFAVK